MNGWTWRYWEPSLAKAMKVDPLEKGKELVWKGKGRLFYPPPPSPSQRLSLKPWSKARWPPSSMISSLFGCVMQLLPLEFNSADWVRVCVWWWERAFHALELQVANNSQNPRQTAEEFRVYPCLSHFSNTRNKTTQHTHTHTQKTILSITLRHALPLRLSQRLQHAFATTLV